MKLRDDLGKAGAGEDYITQGLAGVGNPESMKLRNDLWKAGADQDCIAQGLAGVGNPESMKLRNDLWKAGADKDYIAWGLAGVNTKKAEEFRVKHFKNKPNLIAKSYTTNRIACNGVICRYGYEK